MSIAAAAAQLALKLDSAMASENVLLGVWLSTDSWVVIDSNSSGNRCSGSGAALC
jgi:hypothetical protein